jgi:hypothetical protein
MDLTSLYGRRDARTVARTAAALAVVFLTFFLYLVAPSLAANGDSSATTFEDRAAAEKMSRSRYRDLEVASLVVIVVVGAGAVLWAVRRKKP